MDDANDSFTGSLVRASAANRYASYRCTECRREVRLFRGAERAAHFRHLVVNPTCPLSVNGQDPLGLGFAGRYPRALDFDRAPPVRRLDPVTAVVTFVTPEQRARAVPHIESHEHGGSAVVRDIVFAGRAAGGVRVDTSCSLFAEEDYFLDRSPAMSLRRLLVAVGPRLWKLCFKRSDVRTDSTLRSWASEEGFHLKQPRNRLPVRAGASMRLRPESRDETNALLWTRDWHAAVTIRSEITEWSISVEADGGIVFSGTHLSNAVVALDELKFEVIVESPGAAMRFPSTSEFEPREGPLVRVSYPVWWFRKI